MLNTAIYTGTGIVVAGLGTAYYVYSNRNQNELELKRLDGIQRSHEISALQDAQLLHQQPPPMFRSNFQEVQQEAGDPIDVDSIIEASSPPNFSLDGSFLSRSSEIFEPNGRPTSRRLSASQNLLKSSFHALNSGTGAREGLNVAQQDNNNVRTFSSSYGSPSPLSPASLATRKYSSFEVRQIVSRTQVTEFDPESSAVLYVSSKDSEDTNDSESSADVELVELARPVGTGTTGNSNYILLESVNDSSKSIFDVESDSNFELYAEDNTEDLTRRLAGARAPETLEEIFTTPSCSNEFITTTPLRKTNSPVVYYSNPRFGERYACKDVENMSTSAMLKNIASTKTSSGKIVKCSSGHFQRGGKRRHARPVFVSTRKSEGMVREIFYSGSYASTPSKVKSAPASLNSSNAATVDSCNFEEMPDTAEVAAGHKDSTLFLFPPILSESKISLEAIGLNEEWKRSNEEDIKLMQEYNRQLEQDMSSAEVSTSDSHLFIPHGPIGSSMFDITYDDDETTSTLTSQSQPTLTHGTLTGQFSGWNGKSSSVDGDSSGCVIMVRKQRHPTSTTGTATISATQTPIPRGLVTSIPSDSWINFLLRLVPGDMLPWGIALFIPVVLVILAAVCVLIMMLSTAVSSMSSVDAASGVLEETCAHAGKLTFNATGH